MCEHHAAGDVGDEVGLRPSRRTILQAATVSALAGLSPGLPGWMSPARAATIDGACSMAMHVHASFSEKFGSMNAQLSEATRHGVDVVWWTEHDTKMNGVTDKHVVHFTSLTNETGDGTPWRWQQRRTGSLTSASTGGIVTTPASPSDPVAGGSLRVAAQSTGAATASLSYEPSPDYPSWRTNLADQTISVEVLPTSVGGNAYLELFIGSSHHPAAGGRPAGRYSLSYRIGGPAAPGSRVASGLQGIVTLPTTVGSWNSYTLRPDRDLAALFPDLDPRDFSLYILRLGATSSSSVTARGHFDYLRFARPNTGEMALQLQDDLMSSYAGRYLGVTQRHGLEVSKRQPHINWFGGDISLPTYVGLGSNYSTYLRQTIIPDIHARGGLASYNHPYGVGFGPMKSQATQDSLLRQVASRLLPTRALGADIIEVGYPMREGVDLAHHVGLWDVLSRNAVFLTGNGVSDDHAGTSWLSPPSVTTWTTSVWSDSNTEASLLQRLRSGRAWCSYLNYFGGSLDLLVDGFCPMGSVSVTTRLTRNLTATATGVPTGGTLEVVQGVVDYAGTAQPTSNTTVIASVPRSALTTGSVQLNVDCRESSFVRTQVRDSTGRVVALSNPVWLLRTTPPTGIPAARAA